MDKYDFQLEKKLKREAPELHRIFTDNVFVCQNQLLKYKSNFPNYTDHSALHSLQIIAFCNQIIGDEIDKINPDEIFVLLMAAYLHDSGMGLNEKDFNEFSKQIPEMVEYMKAYPDEPESTYVRVFHNELSGCFIRKYSFLYEFPSEEYVFGVIQASRGHRKTNLFDGNDYPEEIRLPNGNVLRIPYLAALIRLGDEIDVASDRNITFVYALTFPITEKARISYGCHKAIKTMTITEDAFRFEIGEFEDWLKPEIENLFMKLKETLDYCIEVIENRTPFKITQKRIEKVFTARDDII